MWSSNDVTETFSNSQNVILSNGVSINFHEHGNANAPEKVLLIMGLWTTKEAWYPIVSGLMNEKPEGYHIITYDNRGVGNSQSPWGRYTTQLLAEDAVLLMEAKRWDTVHVVGVR